MNKRLVQALKDLISDIEDKTLLEEATVCILMVLDILYTELEHFEEDLSVLLEKAKELQKSVAF